MMHIAAYSGGKDSTAMLLHMRNKGVEFQAVFCDTGWESAVTYEYIERINRQVLNGALVTLRGPRDMRQLVKHKKRVPSACARFCTEHLKIKPMIEYLKSLDDDYEVWQGIRAAESKSRAAMKERDWSDAYDCYVNRPLLHWSAVDVFDIHKHHGIEPNPMYLRGASRVGCFPCVMVNMGELVRVGAQMPEMWDRIKELEGITRRSFFGPTYIPKRFHDRVDPKSGKSYASAEAVRRYVESRRPQDFPLLDDGGGTSCMSVYNLCE